MSVDDYLRMANVCRYCKLNHSPRKPCKKEQIVDRAHRAATFESRQYDHRSYNTKLMDAYLITTLSEL